MKRIATLLSAIACCIGLLGCGLKNEPAQIVATTLPVYDFTQRLCYGTELEVFRLIDEEVACLHDYSLQVDQMQALEGAQIVLASGAGLEDFLEDVKGNTAMIVDLSAGVPLLHADIHHDHHDHSTVDPHYWLAPENAGIMAANICRELIRLYPEHKSIFEKNLKTLCGEFDELQNYADAQLENLTCKKLITFHDGFSYMADAFNLQIAHSVAEESGSEASAQELIELSQLVKEHEIPAIFTEKNGSASAARIIAKEVNIRIFSLDMAMSGNSYFDAMYHNIDTLKEALE